jgi:dTDP-4-dehydrorhamnose reductase
MDVLIIGNGMLGTACYERLLGEKRRVTILGRKDCNLLDRRSIEKAINVYVPDVILNTAAMTNVNACEGSHHAYETNAVGVINLALLARKYRINNLIQVSTDYVYRYDTDRAQTYEQRGREPESDYGISKLLGEEAAKHIMPIGCSLIARITSLYGNAPNCFLYRAISRLKYEGELKMVSDQLFKPSYVKLVAGKICKAINYDAIGEIHIAAKELVSRYEFFKTILPGEKIYPVKTDENETPRRPKKFDLVPSPGYELPTWQEQFQEFSQDFPEWSN